MKTVRCKEYDGVLLKDGRNGTVVGVFPDGVYLVDIDYPQERLHEIEDTTEFIREADIEKVTYEIGKRHHVRVATSDNLEQVIILGHGAFRLSARAFHAEMEQVNGQIAQMIAEHNRKSPKLNQLKLEGQG